MAQSETSLNVGFCCVFVFLVVSYGIGRTGVYCLLHTMYHQIARENTVSIYQVARLYNFQRPTCISTKVRNCLFSLTSVSVLFSGSSGWVFWLVPVPVLRFLRVLRFLFPLLKNQHLPLISIGHVANVCGNWYKLWPQRLCDNDIGIPFSYYLSNLGLGYKGCPYL